MTLRNSRSQLEILSTVKLHHHTPSPPCSGRPSSRFRRQVLLLFLSTLCLFLSLSKLKNENENKTKKHQKREEERQRNKRFQGGFFWSFFKIYSFLPFSFLSLSFSASVPPPSIFSLSHDKKGEAQTSLQKPAHIRVTSLSSFGRLSKYFFSFYFPGWMAWLGLSNFLFLLGLVAKRHSITSLSLMTRLLWSAKTACRQHPDMAHTRSLCLVTKRWTSLTLSQLSDQDFLSSFSHRVKGFPHLSWKWWLWYINYPAFSSQYSNKNTFH